MDIDLLTISTWLKGTVPGIVILGAVGSVIGALILWLLSKIIKKLASYVSNIFSDNAASIIQSYIKEYLILRATLFQLSNKKKSESITALYTSVISTKSTSLILAWITFAICYIIFLLFDTEYLKTSIFFVAVFFLYLHDAIMHAGYQWLIEHYLFGKEKEISISTYDNDIVTLLEAITLLKDNTKSFKDFDTSQLLRDDEDKKKT